MEPRRYTKGIGQAVADRTINRKITHRLRQPEVMTIQLEHFDQYSIQEAVDLYCKKLGYVISHFDSLEIKGQVKLHIIEKVEMEHWKDVALRVARGNTLLHKEDSETEFLKMHHHLRKATLLMSGRHLQHGDETQPSRNMEVFTNCATSAMSFLKFYLLLNGSGVGRSMDDELMLVDYKNLPIIVSVINSDHPDVLSGEISGQLDKPSALHMYPHKTIHVFDVPDSREGWARAVEKIEVMAFQKKYHQDVMILDFSAIRKRGSPIKGMQNRPASGPGPLMMAIEKIARLREAGMPPWRSTMFVDHYLAECILVGGARRAARMATKSWRDASIFEFISLKRGGFLWSSNNSVMVDCEFWNYVHNPSIETAIAKHSRKFLRPSPKLPTMMAPESPELLTRINLLIMKPDSSLFLMGNLQRVKFLNWSQKHLNLQKILQVYRAP